MTRLKKLNENEMMEKIDHATRNHLVTLTHTLTPIWSGGKCKTEKICSILEVF